MVVVEEEGGVDDELQKMVVVEEEGGVDDDVQQKEEEGCVDDELQKEKGAGRRRTAKGGSRTSSPVQK